MSDMIEKGAARGRASPASDSAPDDDWALTDRLAGAMFEGSDPSTGRLLVRITWSAFHDAPKGVLRMHAGTKRLERSPPH